MTLDGVSELEYLSEIVLQWCAKGAHGGVDAGDIRDIARLAKLAEEAAAELRELYEGE